MLCQARSGFGTEGSTIYASFMRDFQDVFRITVDGVEATV